MKIVISSGHALKVPGAVGIISEVPEARRVVDRVAENLRGMGVEVVTFHDDVSEEQSENLNRIVDFHQAQGAHDYDVSVHFNSYDGTASGTEVLYLTEEDLAGLLSSAIADAGHFIDRGAKLRDDLYFLNSLPHAVLIETCFVDSQLDADLYSKYFEPICLAISLVLGTPVQEETVSLDNGKVRVTFKGKCSWFGGPDDEGVDPDEGLAFFSEVNEDNQHLFLPKQPEGTTGLARRLDPSKPYVACRWDYDITPKEMLADPTLRALVRTRKTNLQAVAWPADWGPNESTGREADLSPGLMDALGLDTDDEVEVIYPAPTLIS